MTGRAPDSIVPVPRRWDVLGFGTVTVDDRIYVDHYPPPDTKTPIRAEQRMAGGLTATALVTAARLGARAAYAGVLGDDELSRFTVDELERAGVVCAPVLYRVGARPMHATVIVDRATAQRSILFSDVGFQERQPEEITEALVAATRVLFIDHGAVNGGLHAVTLAHAHGIPVVGDFERVTTPAALTLMEQVDHLILGYHLAREITGEVTPETMVRALASSRHSCCAVTDGERGCWYMDREGDVHHVPAFPVEGRDTTGCGDVFHGAYAACIARDRTTREAIIVATGVAALKAQRLGGWSGIPDQLTVAQFLRERGVAIGDTVP